MISGVYLGRQSVFIGMRVIGQLKSALIGVMYRKINKISFYSLSRLSIGRIINIVANDLNTFDYYFAHLSYLITFPLILAGTIALLRSILVRKGKIY